MPDFYNLPDQSKSFEPKAKFCGGFFGVLLYLILHMNTHINFKTLEYFIRSFI